MRIARILSGGGPFHRAAGLAIGVLLLAAAGCPTFGSRGTPEAQRHNTRGVEHLEAGRYDEAILEFELALKIDPLYTLAKANLGLACHRRGFSDRGIKECEDAIETDPNVADSYDNLGEIYLDQKRYGEAEKQFKLAIDVYPGYDQAWFHLGLLHQKRNEDDKALEAYVTAAQNNPKFVEAQVAAGLLYLKNGVEKDAEQHFLLALEHDPKNPLALHGLGRIALKKEQWEDAIRRFKAIIEDTPNHPIVQEARKSLEETYAKSPPRVAKALVETARAAMDEKKFDRALSDLEAAGRIDPKLVDVPVLKARVYIDGKPIRLADAEKEVKKALALDPKNRDARFAAACVCLLTKRQKVAADLLRRLRREDPKSVKYHNYLGVAYYGLREYRKAEREWLEVLQIDSENADAKKSLETLHTKPTFKKANELNDSGVKALSLGNLDEAADLFRGAIELDDQFAVAFSNLALVSIERGDLKYARQKATEAIKRDPDLGRAHNNLGVVNLRESKHAEAEKNFKEAAALDPRDPEPWHNLGRLCAEQNKWKEAEDAYELALSIDANHYRSHHALAVIYLAKGLFEKAEARLKLAIRTGPKYIPARVDLARLYLRLKRFAEAKQVLEEANLLDDAAPEPFMGFAEASEALGEKANARNALLMAAARFAALARYQEAVEACRRAVELDPQSADAHGDLGVALMSVGLFQESLAELKRADDLDPKNLRHRYHMGMCYGKKGERALAAAAYRDVLKENPDNPAVLKALADLYREGASDNPLTKKEAIELYQKALRLEKDTAVQDLMKRRLKELEK